MRIFFAECILVMGFATAGAVRSQTVSPVALPIPETSGGMPLMEALKARKSTREFSDRKIPLQTLSNLLWAADGVNRPAERRRTAPSAMNRQEIEVYAALEEGLFRYDAFKNLLEPVLAGDHRAFTGMQPFVGTAPVNLVYVATVSTDSTVSEADRLFYPATDAGFIGQNVYLFCASAGLGTVVRGMVDRAALAGKMRLRPDQRILLCQTVGYPRP
jgi:nitroreductase